MIRILCSFGTIKERDQLAAFLLAISLSTSLTGCLMDGTMIGSTLSPASNGSGSSSSNGNSSGNSTSIYQLVFGSPLNQSLQLTAGQDITPSVPVSVVDQNGQLVTSMSFSVSLGAFSDSACTQAASISSEGFTTASTQGGIATFTNIGTTQAGVYYIQASAQGALSACSPTVTIVAGAPDHIGNVGAQGASSSEVSAPAGSSTSVSAQVVDLYGNPVQLSSLVVTFSVLANSGMAPGTVSSTEGVTGSNGIASTTFTFNSNAATLLGLVSASSSGLPHPAPVLIPILLQPGPVHSSSVSGFPETVLTGDSEPALVTVQDSNGNVATSFTGNVTLSGNYGGSTTVTFQASDQGAKLIPIALPSPRVSPSQTLTATGTEIPYSGSESGISVVPYTCILSSADNWSATSGNWNTSSSWSASGSPPLAQSNSEANIEEGSSCSLNEIAQIGCLNLTGELTILDGEDLEIMGSQVTINPAGRLLDNGNGLAFLPASGVGPQLFSNQSGSLVSLNKLGVNFVYPSSSLFLEGGNVQVLSTFGINAGSYLAPIYINNNLAVTGPVAIPSGVPVFINPGASLTALGGITVGSGGSLTIAGNGALYIGAGQTLDVQGAAGSAGNLYLQGLASSGNQAVVSVAPSAPSGSTFTFTVEQYANFQGTHFNISNTGVNGVDFKSGSVIQTFNYGTFSNLASGGTAITLEGSVSLSVVPYFYGLTFIDDLTRQGILAVNASTLTTPIGIIDSSFGTSGGTTQIDTKTRVYDPNSELLWDH